MEWITIIYYDKAVRDLIPKIIKESGRTCKTKTLSDDEFLSYLEVKLGEEKQEYNESKSLMELADLLEVIYRVAELHGSSKKELEKLRQDKNIERGGFQKNIVLLTVQ